MGKFTDDELARMAPGRSPEELAALNMDDGEWERHGAKLLAAHADTRHELDMLKSEGLHDLNSIRYDPEIVAAARVLHNQDPAGPSVDAIIEKQIIPIRERYLERFESNTAPAGAHKAGANEAAFNKLVGGSDV